MSTICSPSISPDPRPECDECEAADHSQCFTHAFCTKGDTWEPSTCTRCQELITTSMGSDPSLVNPAYKALRDGLGFLFRSKPAGSNWSFRTDLYEGIKKHVSDLHSRSTGGRSSSGAALGFFEHGRLFEPLLPQVFQLCGGGVRDLRSNTVHRFIAHDNGTHIAMADEELLTSDTDAGVQPTEAPSALRAHFSNLGASEELLGKFCIISVPESPTFLNNLCLLAREKFSLPEGPFSHKDKKFSWPLVNANSLLDGPIEEKAGSLRLAEVLHKGPIDFVGEALRLNLAKTPTIEKSLITSELKQRRTLHSAISTAICLDSLKGTDANDLLQEILENHFLIVELHMDAWLRSKMSLRRQFLGYSNNENLSASKLLLSDPFCPGLFPNQIIDDTINAAIQASKTARQFLGLKSTASSIRPVVYKPKSPPKPLTGSKQSAYVAQAPSTSRPKIPSLFPRYQSKSTKRKAFDTRADKRPAKQQKQQKKSSFRPTRD